MIVCIDLWLFRETHQGKHRVLNINERNYQSHFSEYFYKTFILKTYYQSLLLEAIKGFETAKNHEKSNKMELSRHFELSTVTTI